MTIKRQPSETFEDKWSVDIAEYSFTQVPNLLLGCQGHLGLKDGELITLIHLLTFWFFSTSRVYPSIETLTKFSHKGYSTIQKRLKSLEDSGFIYRDHDLGRTNTYDLMPTLHKLQNHQLSCNRLPRNRRYNASDITGLPFSFSTNKEDEQE